MDRAKVIYILLQFAQRWNRFYSIRSNLCQISVKCVSKNKHVCIYNILLQSRLVGSGKLGPCATGCPINLINIFTILQVVCDVLFSVKPISNKPALRWTDVYSVEPQRAAVQPHSFSYVTITFQPPSMQVRSHRTWSLVNIHIIYINVVTSFFAKRSREFYFSQLYPMLS